MKRNLDAYALKLDRWIPAETCRAAIEVLADAQWVPHEYSDASGAAPASASGERELDVAYVDDRAIAAPIMRKVVEATRFYTAAMRLPWLAAPRQHSTVRFNRYGPGQLMLEHCDHIQSLFDGGDKGIPVLSCLVQLNDDFEGGELVFWEDEVIDMGTGSILIFPSNFLFPHRVEPVRSGFRYSCVSWAW